MEITESNPPRGRRGPKPGLVKPTKHCKKCNTTKPRTLEHFYKNNKGYFISPCRPCYNRGRKRYDNSPEARARQAHRKWLRTLKSFNLTLEQVEAMLVEQGHACKICRHPFGDAKPCVDHCHAANVFRGLLCNRCNVGLGAFRDNPEFLEQAIKYLKDFQQKAGEHVV